MASERTVRFNFEVNAKTEDIAKLEKGLTSLTKSLPPLSVDLDRARGDILALGQSNLQTTALINGQITALRELQTHVATTSPLYRRLGTDMGQLRGRLGELEASMKSTRTAAQELATALNSGIGASSSKTEGQVATLRRLMGELRHDSQQLAQSYQRLNEIETINSRRSGRLAAAAGNRSVYGATMTSGYGAIDQLPGLPNSANGLNQRLSELSQDLGNVNLGSREYISIMREMEAINTRLASSNNTLSASINQVARAQSAARRQQQAGIGSGFADFSRNPTSLTDQLADQAATARSIRRNQERLANSPMARQFAADIQAMNRTATLALPAGDTSLPAIRGGARSAFRGNANMEFLGGNRSDEQAAYATRVADRTSNLGQKLKQQNDELNQGFAQQAEIITKGQQRSAELMGLTSAAAANNFVSRNTKTPLFSAIEGIGLSKITNQTQLMGQSYGEVASSIRAVTAVSDNSTNSLNQQRQAWQQLGNAVALTPKQLREVNGELQRIDRQLEKRQPRGNRLANFGQTAGAVAASGVFGGPEGLVGSAIGAIGGPAGALAGGAIGAQVGMLRQQIGATADYAAQIDKLNIALRGVAGSASDYAAAQGVIEASSKNLNIPILDATEAFTRLTASVKGAGGEVADAEIVFNGVSNAIKATGGSSEDAKSAILAMSQVFGKGKVSAEELQGQLGERLPGAVTLFAQATGRTLPQLSKDLQNGTVGLNDLMKFTVALTEKYGASARTMAGSTEEAGARMKVSLDQLTKNFGDFFKPVGAGIQDLTAKLADFANAMFKTSQLSEKLKDYSKSLTPQNESALFSDAEKIARLRVLGSGRKNLPVNELSNDEQGKLTQAIYGNSYGRLTNSGGILGELRRDFMTKRLYELNAIAKPNAGLKPTQFQDPAGEASNTKPRKDPAPKYISQKEFADAMKLKGYRWNVGMGGHATPNHDREAMDFGYWGPNADYVGETKRMEELLRATGAFPGLLGPSSDPYGHGEGRKTGNTHLHAPTPNGRIRLTDGLAKYLGLAPGQGSGDLNENVRNQLASISQSRSADLGLQQSERTLEIVKTIVPLDKARLEFEDKRAQRMERYRDLLGKTKSDEEIGYLLNTQKNEALIAQEEYTQRIRDINSENLDLQRASLESMKESMEYMKELNTRGSFGAGAKQGVDEYLKSIGNLRDATSQLTVTGMQGLEDSIVSLSTTGTANFQQFAVSILQDTTRMIVQQFILKSIMQAIGFGSSSIGSSFEMPSDAFIPKGGFSFAQGGAFGSNGIIPFAKGGIVDSPTLFKFAKGGALSNGVMGEAGPEAIMPLKRGADGKLGVAGGGGGTTNISIAVDASGTKAVGDQGRSGALARDLAAVVDQRLVHHKRPGGLLS